MNLKSKLICIALTCCFYQPIFAQTPTVIPLWKNGAPGFENLKNEPEQAKDYWVKHINNPSLTVYLPIKELATGAAVVICPGGGHSLLVIDAEGTKPAKFLNSLGVAAFVLKYRLARETGSPYKLEKVVVEDGNRAMRLVRCRAAEFGIDPKRIGMMGFSAGGEVVDAIAYAPGTGNPQAKDLVERASAKPDFDVLIYPGPLYIPEIIPADAPPAFLLAANNDPCCAVPVVQLLERYRAAKVPIEAHILAQGNHGFNMGNRSGLNSIKTWRQRLADWLEDTNLLHPGKYKAE